MHERGGAHLSVLRKRVFEVDVLHVDRKVVLVAKKER